MSITPAQIFKTLRFEHSFEQEDVALCTGLRPHTIGQIERGAREPTLSELCALLVTFSARFDALFHPLLADTAAEVYARIADHQPPESKTHMTRGRVTSYDRLKSNLNRLHGAAS